MFPLILQLFWSKEFLRLQIPQAFYLPHHTDKNCRINKLNSHQLNQAGAIQNPVINPTRLHVVKRPFG